MHVCHAVAPASIIVVHGGGLWRFSSRPSTLETVYFSWLAGPHKWWSRLTDLEWDIKEPLRTTSSLAVTTLSVPIHLKYILHIHAGCHGAVTMACDFGLKGLGWMGLSCCGVALCPWARHFTCMCTLSTQEWMGTWLNRDCLCVWTATSAMKAAGLYAPQELEMVLEWTGPITRENWCEAHRNLI